MNHINSLNRFFTGCVNPANYVWGISGNVDANNNWNRALTNDRARELIKTLSTACKKLSMPAQSGLIKVLTGIARCLDSVDSVEKVEKKFLEVSSDENLLNSDPNLGFVMNEFTRLSEEDFSTSEKINSPKLISFSQNVDDIDTRTCRFQYSSDPSSKRGIEGELKYNLEDPSETVLELEFIKVKENDGGKNIQDFSFDSKKSPKLTFRPFVDAPDELHAPIDSGLLKKSVEAFYANSFAPHFKANKINFNKLGESLAAMFESASRT